MILSIIWDVPLLQDILALVRTCIHLSKLNSHTSLTVEFKESWLWFIKDLTPLERVVVAGRGRPALGSKANLENRLRCFMT